MASLEILGVIFLLLLILTAWVLGRSARALGSLKGRLTAGLFAILIIILINIPIGIMASMLDTKKLGIPPLGAGLIFITAEVLVAFFVLERAFHLTSRRALIMLGIYIAMGFAEIGIMAGVVKPFLVETFIMPTKSMSPTINPGDRFIVNHLLLPRRWDLVAYHNNGSHPDIYCKRVIGLPGEKLRFDHGNIFINDHAVTAPPVLAGRLRAFPGTTWYSDCRYHEGQTITLGDNQYFFVGDNIDISADSRIYGPSDRSSLVGVVDVIYWPLNKIRILR